MPANVGRIVFKAGLWLQLSVFVGLAFTVRGMMKAFGVLGASGPAGDEGAAQLSSAVGQVLQATLIGLAGNFVGVLLMLAALILSPLRERWVFVWTLVVGILLCPLGLPLLIFCLLKHREFLPAAPRAA